MGEYWVINSDLTKDNVKKEIDRVFAEKKYARVKIDAGKRTLSQNALKSVWYADIAKQRGDVTAKDVERECKYKYGSPILRRDSFRNMLFGTLDKFESHIFYKTSYLDDAGEHVAMTGWEIKMKAMDNFAVTSVMSVSELKEYLDMMQADYPYLDSKK